MDKIQHLFMIKTLNKLRKEGNFLNLIKNISKKPTAHIILNYEKLKPFPLRSGTRQGCPLHHSVSTPYWKYELSAIRQKGKIKNIQIGKEEIKLCSQMT